MTIGLGIVTCDRPDFFHEAFQSVVKHRQHIDDVVVYDDSAGIDGRFAVRGETEMFDAECIGGNGERQGVGHAKNALFRRLLDAEHDWIFLMEDDVVLLDERAIIGYVQTAKAAGYPHLLFAHHGQRNQLPSKAGELLSFWPNCVGAFCLYSREAIERVGLMDEGFPLNCLEHVEHSARILRAYDLPGHPFWPDVSGSEKLLGEQPTATQRRAIRETHFTAGRAYWKQAHPESYLWGDS